LEEFSIGKLSSAGIYELDFYNENVGEIKGKVWGQLRLANEGWKAVLTASESDHTTEIYV
jgi:hypothetical protein